MTLEIPQYPSMPDEQFNSKLQGLIFNVCEFGISKIQPVPGDELSITKFIIEVHNGWKIAQADVKRLVIELSIESNIVAGKLKSSRRARDHCLTKYYELAIRKTKRRITILRKFIDAIIWALYSFEEHYIRRLYSGKAVDNINENNLDELFRFIDHVNSDNDKLAISTDLSTFVHVGDVIIKDISSKSLSIVEVKSGDVNDEIHDVINFYAKSKCDRALYCSLRNFDESKRKQFFRVAKQMERLSNVRAIFSTDEGIDTSTGLNVKLQDCDWYVDDYMHRIMDMYSELCDEQHWSIAVVDECLFIGMYNGIMLRHANRTFNLWMGHIGKDLPIVNYFHSLFVPMARPLFSHPLDTGLIYKIAVGDICLLMALDIPALVDKLRSFGSSIDFLTKKQTNRLKTQQSGFKYIEHEGRALKIVRDGQDFFPCDGLLTKVLFSFCSPLSLFLTICGIRPPTNDDQRCVLIQDL